MVDPATVTWRDIIEFALPLLPLGRSHSSTESTAAYSASDPPPLNVVPQGFVCSRCEDGLVERAVDGLRSGLARLGMLELSCNGGGEVIRTLVRSLARTQIVREASVAFVGASLLDAAGELVEKLCQSRGIQARTTKDLPVQIYSQDGDGLATLEVEGSVRTIVGTEYKWQSAMTKKQRDLAEELRINARRKAVGAHGMLVKMALQLQTSSAKFGIFFAGYSFMAAQLVKFDDGCIGLLVSPLHKTASQDQALPTIGKADPPSLRFAPVLAFLIATLVSDLPDFPIQAPSPALHHAVALPSTLLAIPEDRQTRGDEEKGLKEGGKEDGAVSSDMPSCRSDTERWTAEDPDTDNNDFCGATIRVVYEHEGSAFLARDVPIVRAGVPSTDYDSANPAAVSGLAHGATSASTAPPVPASPPIAHVTVADAPCPDSLSQGSPSSRPPSRLFEECLIGGDASFSSSATSTTSDDAAVLGFLRQPPQACLGLARFMAAPPDHEAWTELRLHSKIQSGPRSTVWRGTLVSAVGSLRVVFKAVDWPRVDAILREILIYEHVLSKVTPAEACHPKFYFAVAMPDRSWAGIVLSDSEGVAFPEDWGSSVGTRSGPALSDAVMRAARALHALGIEHGDFEPRNVLRIGESSAVCVVDYERSMVHDCEGEACEELQDLRRDLVCHGS